MDEAVSRKKGFPAWIIIAAVVVLAVVTVGGFAVARGSVHRKVKTRLELARKYVSELNYEQAIITYKAIIEIDPKNADAYGELFEVYITTGDIDSAEDLIRIIESNLSEEERAGTHLDTDVLKTKIKEKRAEEEQAEKAHEQGKSDTVSNENTSDLSENISTDTADGTGTNIDDTESAAVVVPDSLSAKGFPGLPEGAFPMEYNLVFERYPNGNKKKYASVFSGIITRLYEVDEDGNVITDNYYNGEPYNGFIRDYIETDGQNPVMRSYDMDLDGTGSIASENLIQADILLDDEGRIIMHTGVYSNGGSYLYEYIYENDDRTGIVYYDYNDDGTIQSQITCRLERYGLLKSVVEEWPDFTRTITAEYDDQGRQTKNISETIQDSVSTYKEEISLEYDDDGYLTKNAIIRYYGDVDELIEREFDHNGIRRMEKWSRKPLEHLEQPDQYYVSSYEEYWKDGTQKIREDYSWGKQGDSPWTHYLSNVSEYSEGEFIKKRVSYNIDGSVNTEDYYDYEYDSSGRAISQKIHSTYYWKMNDGNGGTYLESNSSEYLSEKYEYWDNGNMAKAISYSSDGAVFTIREYDENGSLRKTTVYNTDGSVRDEY